MGRIKNALTKRTARALLKEKNIFETGFERNKKLIGNTMPSKRLRNRIAGYVTRLKRNELKKHTKVRSENTEEEQ
jgi:ribosomal protein S17E